VVDWTEGYGITSDGIDIGDDGNVTPWSETPWNSSIDFERSTRNLVQTEEVGGRTFEVYAEPDRLGRGPKGLNYDVEPADGGEKPEAFGSVMTSRKQVRERFERYAADLKEQAAETRDANRGREDTEKKVQTLENGWVVWTFVNESGEQRWYVKTDDGYLQSDASTSSSFYAFSSQSAMESAITDATTPESIAELGYGWVLSETPDGEFFVAGRKDGGRVYLEGDGSTVSKKQTFASKKKARRAFRRWEDENVAAKREEANAARMEASEEFTEALEQRRGERGSGTTVDVETSKEGSGATTTGTPTVSTATAPEFDEIPVAAVGVLAVVLGLYLLR
jgi:hypothetical protein